MTGIKIPIQADVAGVKDAMNELVQKAGQITATLGSGKAKLDTSSAKKSMQELEGLVSKLHQSLENAGNVDIGDKALDGMTDQFESAVKEANDLAAALQAVGVQAAGGFSKSAAATRTLIRELERARRLQQVMAREGHTLPMASALHAEREFQRRVAANVPGSKRYQKNNGLADVASSWRDMAMNETDARRKRRELLRSVGIESGSSSLGGGSGGGGGGGSAAPAPAGQRSFSQFVGASGMRAGRSMLGAAMPSGVGGSLAHGAVSEAAASEGGMFSMGGLARLGVGGAIAGAAYLGVKAIGAVKARLNTAEGEGVGYADMSRSMGAGGVDFNQLREAVRGAAVGMGMAYEESQKLAMAYSKQAGSLSMGGLHDELKGAIGFSRGFGLDPSQGADFFGTMRHNKVSSGDADNRRIALMIADAIGKAGVFHKTDEVLQAVSAFTVQATRASFTTANVGGYMGGMSSLMGTGLPGMDPSAAASLLGKADGAIRGGGSLAAQNFMLGIAQQAMPDMNATEIGFLKDGGAFGTAESAFGAGSPFQKMAANDPALSAKGMRMAKQGGTTTNIERFMKGAKQYGAGTMWTKENLKGLLGFTDSEAASFMAADANGGIGKSLDEFKSAGFDPATMKMSAVKGMMTTKYGSHEDRMSQVKYLQGLSGADALSKEDSNALSSAVANPGQGDKNLREILTRLVATKDMEKTEGDRSRDSMKDIENAITSFASKLIPIANSIREGVVWGAKKLGYTDTYGNSEDGRAQVASGLAGSGSQRGRAAVLKNALDDVRKNPGNYTAEYRKEIEEQYAKESAGLGADTGGVGGGAVDLGGKGSYGVSVKAYDGAKVRGIASRVRAPSSLDGVLRQAAMEHGVPFELLKARAVQESGLDPMAQGPLQANGDQAFGLMQLSRGKLSDMGVKDWRNPLENARAGAKIMAKNMRDAGGDWKHASELYYAGSPKGIGPNSLQYGENSAAIQRALVPPTDTPMPAGSSVGSPESQALKLAISGAFTLHDKSGAAAADPVLITQFGAPQPSGTRGFR